MTELLQAPCSCASPVVAMSHHNQWRLLSRNIGSVTPKIIRFYYEKRELKDQIIQKRNWFHFEKNFTDHNAEDTRYVEDIRYSGLHDGKIARAHGELAGNMDMSMMHLWEQCVVLLTAVQYSRPSAFRCRHRRFSKVCLSKMQTHRIRNVNVVVCTWARC